MKSRVEYQSLRDAGRHLGDVVVDPSQWPNLMEDISRAVGASGALLLQCDVRTLDVPRTASVDEGVRYYFNNNWHLSDTRAKYAIPLFLRGQTVVIDQDLMSPEQFRRDAFYNDCLIPHKMPWFSGIRFLAGTAMWALTLQRTSEQGPFGEKDKRVLSTISARLTEAATLSTAVGRIALSSAINALEGVRQPAVAIDRDGRMLNTNEAAQDIFDDDIFVHNGFIDFRDKEASRRFDTFLRRMRLVPDLSELPADTFAVPRPDRRPVIVNVMPVPPAARGPFLGARAILTMTPVEPRRGLNESLLMKVFSLTRAEARAASLIAEGLSPDQAAQKLLVSVETLRAQLKSVFAKTGTHRQSELVALLSRL